MSYRAHQNVSASSKTYLYVVLIYLTAEVLVSTQLISNTKHTSSGGVLAAAPAGGGTQR